MTTSFPIYNKRDTLINTYEQICDDFSLLFPHFFVSLATITVLMFRGTYFIDITTIFIGHLYSDEIWPPRVFYTVALKSIFFHSFSNFRRSIDKTFVSITTKIWPKIVRQNFVSTQNRGTVSTNYCLSISEFWKLNINFFHAKLLKTNLYRQNLQLNDNCSTKLRRYSDGIRGNPPRVLTFLKYP